MSCAGPDRAGDSLTRIAAGVVVPGVAVAAHGLGAGAVPGVAGMVLAAAVGVLAALLLGDRRRRSAIVSVSRAAGVLTVAQIAAHTVMTMGPAHAGAHDHHDAVLPMLLTHIAAIPLSAALIVVAAGLLATLTTAIGKLTAPPVIAAPAPAPVFWVAPTPGLTAVIRGIGVRGPPA
ncbi:YtxH domain-containing protein [Gordonia sp. PKS22-38]|uniref:YtxH domain-containing protein n=1 Tax=Gordonia prachuapensis TaxID=3115651 RepID=A0ABU7MT75_9ACTN|nr:YtxH domain-containing protein [Gordonia sp. PKS22-38]